MFGFVLIVLYDGAVVVFGVSCISLDVFSGFFFCNNISFAMKKPTSSPMLHYEIKYAYEVSAKGGQNLFVSFCFGGDDANPTLEGKQNNYSLQ